MLFKYQRLALGLMSSVFFLSCKTLDRREEDYNLALVSLKLNSENYGLLNSQLFTKRPADAQIRIKGSLKVDCRISYAGRSSLDAYRKSYDLFFCGKSYKERSSYRLSAQSMDRSLLRAIVGYKAFKKMGLDAPETELASAYINYEYMGLYLLTETVDEEFYAKRGRSVREMYKARYGNSGFKKEFSNNLQEAFSYEGKPDNYALLEGVYKTLWTQESDEEFVQQIDKVLDVDSFLSYMATALYIAHWDGFDNNYFLVFDRSKRKLTLTPWDLDRVWEKTDLLGPEDLIARNELLLRLLKNAEYQRLWSEKLAQLRELCPVEQLIAEASDLHLLSQAAYENDPVLTHYASHEEVFRDLVERMRAWDLRIREYQASLAD